jgi:hypothetical protein
MFVKKQRIGIVLLAMLTMAILASTCFAVEAETVKVQGFVSVIKDVNGAITSVQLDTDDVTYNVELNPKGKELGEKMEDEKVEVEGIVSQKDGQEWLTVLTFKVVDEEEQ